MSDSGRDLFLQFIGMNLWLLVIIVMIIGLILDILFLTFPKVKCKIIDYHISPTFPEDSYSYIHYIQLYNLNINYEYTYNGELQNSSKLNHYKSFERGSPEKVEEALKRQLTVDGHIYAYVCPFIKNYAILFPLKFNYIKNGIVFIVAISGFVMFHYIPHSANLALVWKESIFFNWF